MSSGGDATDTQTLANGSKVCLDWTTNETSTNVSCYDYPYYSPEFDQATVRFYYFLWSIVTPVLFSLIIAVGIAGNLLVIYVIVSHRSMQTPTNYLLINLALSDLAFLIICVPITAYKFAAFTYPFGDIGCRVISYVMYVTAYVTVYTLVAVSVLRYATVVHSNSTARYRTKRNVISCNILIWIVIMLVNIPSLFAHKLKEFDVNLTYCGMIESSIKPFFVTFFVFGYTLPLAIICGIYLIILNHLREVSCTSLGQTRERTARASKVILLVVIVFSVFWLPLHINQLLSSFGRVPNGKWYEVFRILAYCLAYGNSCANPIIYNFVSKDFKRGFSKAVCCCKGGVQARIRENGAETEQMIMVQTHKNGGNTTLV